MMEVMVFSGGSSLSALARRPPMVISLMAMVDNPSGSLNAMRAFNIGGCGLLSSYGSIQGIYWMILSEII